MSADVQVMEAQSGQSESVVAQPIEPRETHTFGTMARTGIAILLHDRLKLLGILAGVIFAVVLSNQQLATFGGLIARNIMLAQHGGADIWITPPFAEQLVGGDTMSDSLVYLASTDPGVAWSAPLIVGGGTLKLPAGGSEPVQVVGVELPALHGGPWNIVAGDPRELAQPDAMFFEDSDREKFGGLNIGSVREVSGHRVQAVGFTVGLEPFGPSYAFTSFDTAREITKVDNHLESFVLVGVKPGQSPKAVADRLQALMPRQRVMTVDQIEKSTAHYIITKTAIGVTFGTSALFGMIVGFVIVALTMFSAVVDHLKEFGTLKAIGATNGDLTKLLVAQALFCALVGSFVGETLVSLLIHGISSPKLVLVLPSWLMAATVVLMTLLCVLASGLALVRLRKLEPAMVFRG